MYQNQTLNGIDNLILGNHKILLEDLKPFRMKECVTFVVTLKDKRGVKSNLWVVQGMFSSGRSYIKPWMDISYRDQVGFPPEKPISLYREGSSLGLFQALGDLIPPGGHMMVSYDDEDAIHRITERALALSFPPFVTPLGHLLVQAGFLSIKVTVQPLEVSSY